MGTRTVDKNWVANAIPREKIREMIDSYCIKHAPVTHISGDYLDHVLYVCWNEYLNSIGSDDGK